MQKYSKHFLSSLRSRLKHGCNIMCLLESALHRGVNGSRIDQFNKEHILIRQRQVLLQCTMTYCLKSVLHPAQYI